MAYYDDNEIDLLSGISQDELGAFHDELANPEDLDDDVLGDVEILGDLITDNLGDDDLIGDDDEILGGFFDSIAKVAGGAIKGVVKVGKSIVKSPITKVVAGAAAIVIPPVGIPASAALVVADRAVRTMEGFRGDPKKAAVVRQAVTATAQLAKKGDPDARRAVEFIKLAERLRHTQQKRAAAPRARGTLVYRNPKTKRLVVERADWQKG